MNSVLDYNDINMIVGLLYFRIIFMFLIELIYYQALNNMNFLFIKTIN